MTDGRYEADRGWGEGVGRGDRDGEEPAAVCEVLVGERGDAVGGVGKYAPGSVYLHMLFPQHPS